MFRCTVGNGRSSTMNRFELLVQVHDRDISKSGADAISNTSSQPPFRRLHVKSDAKWSIETHVPHMERPNSLGKTAKLSQRGAIGFV
jgi:hypothetical protein